MSGTDEPSAERRVAFSVNGVRHVATVPVRQNLVDYLRERLGLTGSHIGCEQGICGACTIRVDGTPVRGCLMLTVQADGAAVETIEGLTETDEIADLQHAFVARNAAQCGFCTAGVLVTAAALLRRTQPMNRTEIRAYMSGNYCRCTGYQAIVDAIETTLTARLAGAKADDGR
jgi:aerobic carbon-monoxide dehydrogenase small subunit